jgi:hypothetical protein
MRKVTALGLAVGAWFGAETTAQATVQIDVNLSTQRMHVVSDTGAAYDWPISSGRPGHLTPTGHYRPQQMYRMIHSWKYNNAPMPHAIFFSGNFAIHGTDAVYALGHVASHGCVRLAPQNAATLFDLVSHEGAEIAIAGAPNAGFAENPHRAGHKLAAAQRKRMQEQALGYAPTPRHKTLKQWMLNPTGTH